MRITETMARAGILAVAAGAMLAACSGSVTLAPQPSSTAFQGFANATAGVCVQPSTSSQVVSLPSIGGVSGTMSFGPFAAGATGCDEVIISTGADVNTTASRARFAQSAKPEANAVPTPILTISVGEGLSPNPPLFGNETVVTGMQLTVSPDLHFPDGTYYATITTVQGNISTLFPPIQFTAQNGVLTVSAIQLPNGSSFPQIVIANTSSIIKLYARGVIPPVPTPAPTVTPAPTASPSPSPIPSGPTATPSSTPTPSGSPTEFPTGMPIQGAVGNPPPAVNAVIGAYSFMDPSSESCQPAQVLCNGTNVPITQVAGNEALISIPANFYGTIQFAANIGYMGLYPPIVITCPSDWTVVASIDGSGSVSIPSSDTFGNAPCTIVFSTLPPSSQYQTYYQEELGFSSVDGVPCSNGVCTPNARRRRP